MAYVSSFKVGSAAERDLLGGKGANLAEMIRMGLPVPPGFTITTAACRAYLRGNGLFPGGLRIEVDDALRDLEQERGQVFGDPSDPLLVSVRSGAPVSMPGMMDTVLDLGLNHETLKGLVERTGDERFAYDAYRRFLEMFGKVVLQVPEDTLAQWRDGVLGTHGVESPDALDLDGLHDLVQAYRQAIRSHTGSEVPDDPRRQLDMAIEAVFRSWNGRRARDYRAIAGIPDDLGTAVNVQAMVFGNAGDDSGTGVAFTRNPVTGEAQPYGDFLLNAQGEDVVAGIRTTEPLAALADHFPQVATQLGQAMERLEDRFRDMCDIEFTIERGELFLLQTRVGKRTVRAAVRMAVEMHHEGLIPLATALYRVEPSDLDRLLHPQFTDDGEAAVASGLAASPGAASGRAVFTADDAEEWAQRGDPVILIRPETSPDDLHGMLAAEGILTSRGGLVSHAAVVARGIGKPAICGASDLVIDVPAGECSVGDVVIRRGDRVSIDGTTGELFLGDREVVVPDPAPELSTFMSMAADVADLEVRANADTAADAARARSFGATGIGLCRTEHMFLGDRLPVVQRMLLASSPAEKQAGLVELHDVQVADFAALLTEMDGLPVTVRLLDPPLHEFLPGYEELLVADARGELLPEERAAFEAAGRWREVNPMLGTRGVRLGLLMPELYAMQVRALAEAVRARREAGGDPRIEVMIPLVSLVGELETARRQAREVLVDVLGSEGADAVLIGTMIETPRAALIADQLAEHAQFFSFGTNDLTQMTYGFSRDDVAGRVLAPYEAQGLLTHDPFRTIDPEGVGHLVRYAVAAAREVRPDLEIGMCGEHGGDPASVRFCHEVGLDYVSCSPFRVVVARLAAAQAALGGQSGHEGE